MSVCSRTDALVCPLVSIGGWKQLVLLPSRLLTELSREQTRSILAHELAHLRRHDHWVRCFELIVLALFWWNPIAWWASRRLRQAEEECCDAWVVWALPECRRSYGQALLRTVEVLTEGRMIAPIAGAEFGKYLFTKRIEMNMKKETPHRMPWLGRAATMVLGITMLPLATVAVSDETSDRAEIQFEDDVKWDIPASEAADGRIFATVLKVRNFQDLEESRSARWEFITIDPITVKWKRLTGGLAGCPRVSPDGRHLAYFKVIDGSTHVRTHRFDGGMTETLIQIVNVRADLRGHRTLRRFSLYRVAGLGCGKLMIRAATN